LVLLEKLLLRVRIHIENGPVRHSIETVESQQKKQRSNKR